MGHEIIMALEIFDLTELEEHVQAINVIMDHSKLKQILNRLHQDLATPKCPTGHYLRVSSLSSGKYERGFICGSCQERGKGERWFCPSYKIESIHGELCQGFDLCFECCPLFDK